MKTAIVDGASGQDGTYLASYLLSLGYVVVGIKRRTSLPNDGRLQLIKHSNLFIENGDVTDAASIRRIVRKYKPDEFYHLAAQSHVGFSSDAPQVTQDINCGGTVNTLEAIKDIKRDCKYYFAGSSEAFGDQLNVTTPGGYEGLVRLDENSKMDARSPYGASKIFGYNLTRYYREAYDMFACVGILFNHESAIRGENFVTRKITKSIADIFAGKSNHITLGNVKAKRDWSFAGDMVKGMHMILQHEEPDDFILASGKAYSVEDFLVQAFNVASPYIAEEYGFVKGVGESYDFSIEEILDRFVKIDRKFLRPSDIEVLLGDASKAKSVLGWEPEVPFEKLVELMVKYDMYAAMEKPNRRFVADALYLQESKIYNCILNKENNDVP